MNGKCTCVQQFETRRRPDGTTYTQPFCRMFTPGCPVHAPPADEDDRFSEPFDPQPAARTI